MKAVCMLSKRLNTRYAFSRWIQFANFHQEIDNKALALHQRNLIEQKREAI
jgi:hypothetical protein